MLPRLSEKKLDILLAAVCVAATTWMCARIFLSFGHPYSLDGASHVSQAGMVYDSLVQGELPFWTNRWYGGFPLLQFYPPLFFYLTALLNLLVNNLIFSVKLIAFTGQLLSGITAYLLVKEITGDRQAGVFGGVAFALAPWHVFQVLDFCRHTVIFIYAFLPLPFLFFEKFLNRKLTLVRAGILIGLSLTLLIYLQYTYALFITLLLTLYIIFHAVQRKPYVNFRHLQLLGLSGLVCLATSLPLTVPYITEGRYLSMPFKLLSEKGFPMDSATFSSLVVRREFPDFHKGYIGLSFLILSLPGIYSCLRRERFPLVVMYAFCFYVVLGHETHLYQFIPFIYAQQATERLILYLILFMAIMAGEGIRFLKDIFPSKNRGQTWQVVILLLLGICLWDVSVTRNRSWAKPHIMARVFENFSRNFNGHDPLHVRTIRTLLICTSPGIEWMFNYVFPATLTIENPVSIVSGYLPFQAPKTQVYINDGKKWAKQEIINKGRIVSSYDFFYLTNVSKLIYLDAKGRISFLNIPGTTPVIASGKLGWKERYSRYPDQEAVGIIEPYIRELGLDKKRNHARQLLLIDDLKLPERPFGPDSQLRVLNFEQTVNKSFLEVESGHDCYLQLAHSYYPFLRVYMDDREVKFYESAIGTISLAMPAGKHRIRIEPYLSFTRKLCYAVSLIFLVMTAVCYRLSGKRLT